MITSLINSRNLSEKDEILNSNFGDITAEKIALKQEIDEYRKLAVSRYSKFLDVTDVTKLEEVGAFIFLTKEQLFSFLDKIGMNAEEDYLLYGLVDICDLTDSDFESASVISNGEEFYRGIKRPFSENNADYCTVDYSLGSLGKKVKPISKFALNLKALLERYEGNKEENERLLEKLVACAPSSACFISHIK